jgi:hypothetical protein
MILVTGDARVPARTRPNSGDGLIFTVISVCIDGIVERYGGASLPRMMIRHVVADS